MARRGKRGAGGGESAGWIVTFSDLMTLLLTFFVLLLSMSSMDRTMLSRVSPMTSNASPISHSGRGRVPDRIRLLLQMLRDQENIREQLERIKDLLFPNDILPPELSPGKLADNLRVLAHPEGVVIVLTEGVLFPAGGHALDAPAQKLLSALTPLFQHSSADISISGFTDDATPPGTDPFVLSGQRAMSVLEYFLQQKLKPSRFSISGYGPLRPLEPNTGAAGRARNRRVEILLKTVQWLGRYQ
jgi:chemotaxis protein MotB